MPVVMVGFMKTLLFCNYVMTAGTCPDIVNGIFPDMLSLSGRTAAENIPDASGIFHDIF